MYWQFLDALYENANCFWDLENDIQPILATRDPKNDLGIKFFLHIFD